MGIMLPEEEKKLENIIEENEFETRKSSGINVE